MKKKLSIYIFTAAVSLVVFSCKQITKATDIITNPTPREVYKRDFKNKSPKYLQWEKAFNTAFNDSISVKLPYTEHGKYYPQTVHTYSYDTKLQKGQIFNVSIQTDSLINDHVFIDLYKRENDTLQKFSFIKRAALDESVLRYIVEENGAYKLIIQPSLEANSTFNLKVFTTPLYTFPVSGKGNADVQSFWGADRDGGRRKHEGIDIFAPRGTPVVAATDGWVSSTGNRGLGGKQVWLRAGVFGNSLYYAHLDSIAVKQATRVKTGDTLGYVGNTGNARTTPPHLHFGIYEGRSGAINPFPYVFESMEPLNANSTPAKISPQIKVISPIANLRASPFLKAKKIGEATSQDTLKVLGISSDWLHIQTPNTQKAYVHKSLARFL